MCGVSNKKIHGTHRGPEIIKYRVGFERLLIVILQVSLIKYSDHYNMLNHIQV